MDLLQHQKGSSTDLGADALRGKLLALPCRFMHSARQTNNQTGFVQRCWSNNQMGNNTMGLAQQLNGVGPTSERGVGPTIEYGLSNNLWGWFNLLKRKEANLVPIEGLSNNLMGLVQPAQTERG
ncbi:hypothetical protein ACFX15_028776 [Malus domestica]